ncbi:MAG: SDR family NAD(P)-dependent oxidoreductase [Caldisericia bacterium]|nr:SDR family NAD(P)-dependent oxidoreductase [Caldisericia bacterium]
MKTKSVFSSKYALITGATSGIGKSIAIELAKENCNLVIASRNFDSMKALKDMLEDKYNVSVDCITIDLSVAKSSKIIFDFCKSNNIQISILVNNSGFALATKNEFTQLDKLERMIILQTVTVTDLCSQFISSMKKNKFGYILNVSSITAITPAASTLTYSAVKKYILTYSRLLHAEVYKDGVKVCCLLPGATDTSFDKNSNLPVPKKLKRYYVSPDYVAIKAISALKRGATTVTPGFQAKFLYFIGVIFPSGLIYRLHKFFWVNKRDSYLK